jgi:hypothetical protein
VVPTSTSVTPAGEQHRPGAVVHGERVLGGREQAQQARDLGAALAALARGEVQLEGGVGARGGHHGLGHFARQHGAPEVGVEDHPARVHDAQRARPREITGQGERRGPRVAGRVPGRERAARGRERAPRPLAEAPTRQIGPRLLEGAYQPVHRRQATARIVAHPVLRPSLALEPHGDPACFAGPSA